MEIGIQETERKSKSSWGVLETLKTLNDYTKNQLKYNKNYYLPVENN